jgi:mannose-6-phosphate isomerase-like protein (cupin superfamily)
MGKKVFPEMITDLPEIDIPFEGMKGWLLQGIDRQVIFLIIEPIGKRPEHYHGEEWGVVIEGEVELVVDGVKKVYRKGDEYHIPAGIFHSATYRTQFKAIAVFAEANLFKPKRN